jgi:kynurenine formamidase
MADSDRPPLLSEQSEWPGGFGNWGRWDNDRGTLNLITPERVLAAARAVRDGQTFAVSAPMVPEYHPEKLRASQNLPARGFEHEIVSAAEFAPGRHAASDRIGVSVHSLENTHIDALSHIGHLGKAFNGVPFEDVVSTDGGAVRFDNREILGIATRAILVDVPRIRGVEYLGPGDSVSQEDLEAGAPDAEPGDALLVRTGRWLAPRIYPDSPGAADDVHGDWAAMGVNAMRFVADRDIAVLGTDSVGDTFPAPFPAQPSIHILAEVYLGIPLVHSLYLEDVAAAVASDGRREMLFCVGTLNVEGGTGSPVTPLCIR